MKRNYEPLSPAVVAQLYLMEDRRKRKEIMEFLVYAFSRGTKIPEDLRIE